MSGRYETFAPRLAQNNWDVTPVNGKRPILSGWASRPATAQEYHNHSNASIGILTGGQYNVVAVDVDVLNPFAANELEKLAEDCLGLAPARIGRAPKFLTLYRCSEAVRKTKTGTYNIDDADAAVEILAEGQQFVAAGVHPDTQRKYEWPGDSILDLTPDDLTVVTPEQLDTFLGSAATVLSQYGALKGRVSDRAAVPATTGGLSFTELTGEAREIEAALTHLPNADEHYDDWISTLHAIKGAMGDDAGRDLAHRWSKLSSKYDEAETDRAWNSITMVRKIGAGSLFHWASQHGFDLKALRDSKKTASEKQAAKEVITGRILSLSQLSSLPPPVQLVDGLIYQNTLINVFGPPASFKSFLALDIALSIAHGCSWHGRGTKTGPVLYIAAEGSSGIRKRATAWMQDNGIKDNGEPFFVLPQAVNIRDHAEVEALIAETTETLPKSPMLVVIDTLARSFGGGDENNGESMGEFIVGCDAIRNAFDGAAVMIVHHSGKDTTRGARGHSSLFGAVDTELELKRSQGTDTVSIRNSKQKDAEESDAIRLTARVVALPPSGALSLTEESSIVLDDAAGNEATEKRYPQGANQKAIHAQITRAINEVGKEEYVNGKTRTVITGSAARNYAYMVIEKGDSKDRRAETFKRAVDAMRERGIISFYNEYYWMN